jgi:hypothetical protein
VSTKVSVKAKPTFKAKVEIPAPGGPIAITFEFKHRGRKEWEAYCEGIVDRNRRRAAAAEALAKGEPVVDAPPEVEEVDDVLDMVCGWDGDKPFNRESLAEFLDDFHASSHTIGRRYHDELTQARLGN